VLLCTPSLCTLPPPAQLKIASQVYDFIDAHIRDLDTDLSNFRTEVSEDRSKLGLGEDTTAREALGRPALAAPPKAEQQKQQGGGEGRQGAQQKKKTGRRKAAGAAAAAAAAAAPVEEPGEAGTKRRLGVCLWLLLTRHTGLHVRMMYSASACIRSCGAWALTHPTWQTVG
jgi:hypothetical protein